MASIRRAIKSLLRSAGFELHRIRGSRYRSLLGEVEKMFGELVFDGLPPCEGRLELRANTHHTDFGVLKLFKPANVRADLD